MSKGYLSLRLEQLGERNYRVKTRVQDATNRFIRQRLAISLRQSALRSHFSDFETSPTLE